MVANFNLFDQWQFKSQNIIAVAEQIAVLLEEGQSTINTKKIQILMTQTFGGSDATGLWQWKDAYEALEVALVKYLQSKKLDSSPLDTLKWLQELEKSLPTHTKRTAKSVELQQFSTPITLSYLATLAAAITPEDVILEPSTGNGMLVTFASQITSQLILNEVELVREANLKYLFPQAAVSHHNGEQINNRLNQKHKPTVVLINPPFSSYLNRRTRENRVMFEHLTTALERVIPQGRLVLISNESVRPNSSIWVKRFTQIQKSARVIFSVGIPGKAYYKQGTTINTRITVIDKVPATNAESFCQIHPILELEKILTLISELPRKSQQAKKKIKPKAAQIPLNKPRKGKNNQIIPGQLSIFNIVPRPQPQKIASSSKPNNNETKQAKFSSTNLKLLELKSLTQKQKTTVDWSNPRRLEYTTLSLKRISDEHDSLYQPYQIQNLQIPQGKAHPAVLVESAAMASVIPPKPIYQPLLPSELVNKGILSEVQLETIIRAGQAHQKLLKKWVKYDPIKQESKHYNYEEPGAIAERQGFYCADGTGLGKSRIIAGVILDNWLQRERKAVWITISHKLIEDVTQEWLKLGGKKEHIFSLNQYRQGQKIDHNSGILFCTYSTLRSAKKDNKHSRLEQVLSWLGENFTGVIAFDEAHAMGGAMTRESKRGNIKASQQGLAGVALQNRLPNAKVLYASATSATKVENLAYAERLGLWGTANSSFGDRQRFISQINKGGVGAMEVVARDMKALGVYLSRNLGYQGVEYQTLVHNLTPEQVEIYNKYSECYQIIHKNIYDALHSTHGFECSNTKRNAYSSFEGSKQRFFNQLLLSMKCPLLIKGIEENLAQGYAPIVQLISTNEAILTRELKDIDPKEYDDLNLNLTPREEILTYLDRAFPIYLMEIREVEGNTIAQEAVDEEGNKIIDQKALALKEKLIRDILLLPPITTALDQLIFYFGEQIAEVTGRSKRLAKYQDQEGEKIKLQTRAKSANLADANAFMQGDKSILVFSTAGGTGASYHASKDCANQKKRVHYILEAGFQATVAIQGFGRSNRSNQVVPPKFVLLSTNIKGEKRFISTIASRLDSLGALTKGQRATGSSGVFNSEDNLENKYAWHGLNRLYSDINYNLIPGWNNDRFKQGTGISLSFQDRKLRKGLPPMHVFLNRLLAMKVEEQNELFEQLETRIKHSIAEAKENGNYETGVETIKALRLEICDRKTLWQHPDTDYPTVVNKVKRTDKNQIRTLREINQIAEDCDGNYVYNQLSQRVALSIAYSSETNAKSGKVINRYKLICPQKNIYYNEEDFRKSNWQELPYQEFKRLWKLEVSKLPPKVDSYFYLITGLLLPIWERLNSEHLKIWRLTTSDTKESILGRIVEQSDIEQIYREFNQKFELTPKEIVANLETQDTISLDNGWKIKLAKVANHNRIELLGWNPTQYKKLIHFGCFEEVIDFNLRIFIPQDKATSIIQSIVK